MSIGVYPGVLDTAGGGGGGGALTFPVTNNGATLSGAADVDGLSIDIPETSDLYFRFVVNSNAYSGAARNLATFKSGGNVAARLRFTGTGIRLEFEDGGGTFDGMTGTFVADESTGEQVHWGRIQLNSATSEAWYDLDGTATDATTYDTTISSYTSIDEVCFQNVASTGSTIVSEIWLGEEWAPPASQQISGLYGFNGTNGATTFDDEGVRANDLTGVGSAQITTSTAKFGSASLESVDASGSYFETEYNDDFVMVQNGYYCVECWINFDTLPSTNNYQICGIWGSAGNYSWQLRYTTTGNLEVRAAFNGSSIFTPVQYAWTPSTGTWYHIRYQMRASGVTLFIDGTVVDTGTDSTYYASSNVGFTVGGNPAFTNGFDGKIDELRFTKNWTPGPHNTSFTAPTTPFDRP